MKRVKHVNVNRISINQFNAICNDFIDTNVTDINYVGFMHTLLYTYLRENYRTNYSSMYESLVDFC